MSESSISLAEASRDFASLVGRARSNGESIVIEDKGEPLARLSPVIKPARTCADLASRIASHRHLDPDDATALGHEIDEARRRLRSRKSKWD